jgi:cysteine desulfurase family protein
MVGKPLKKLIYLDNGATSFPKPPAVWEAMENFLKDVGGSPGRSGHRLSQEASRIVFECRETLGGLFHAPDSKQIIFTLNATQALNCALLGLLQPGDRVLTTSVEHSSVMRPLRNLTRTRGIVLDVLPCDRAGRLDLDRLGDALRTRPRILVATHASNVTGALLPARTVGEMTSAAGTLFLLDAAQSAGAIPIDVQECRIDALAFTGHKSLLGPQGTGGLWIREGLEVEPVFRGGTGSNSEQEEQPDFYPDHLECGTHNAVGLAGLRAAVDFIRQTGVDVIREHEERLLKQLLEGLGDIPHLVVHGPAQAEEQLPVVSFTISGTVPSEVGFALEESYAVLTRVGLHCAPSAHRTIGTFPQGTVRISPGFFNVPEDIERVIEACRSIAARKE